MRLSELRKNPHQNKKYDVLEELKQYIGDGYCVSFSSLKKIGIYPQSDWDTPNGVYAYQIDQYANKMNAQRVVDDVFPYGAHRPYVYVLKPLYKNPMDFDNDMGQDDYVRKLVMFQRMAGIEISDNILERANQVIRRSNHTQALYYILRKYLSSDTNTFNKLLRVYGYDAVVDNGHGVLHSSSEPIQTVFLTPQSYQVVDLLHNTHMGPENRQEVFGGGKVFKDFMDF